MRNNLMKNIYQALFSFFGFLLIVGCQLDSPEPQEDLLAEVVGKWAISSGDFSLLNKENYQSDKSRFSSANKGFIEFLSDGTFILVDGSSRTKTGKYTVNTDLSLALEGLGVVKDIQLKGDVLAFHLEILNQVVSVESKKVQAVKSSEKTDLLCRTWVLDIDQFEKDNKFKLFSELDLEIEYEGYTLADIRVEVTFLNSGTYMSTLYGKGKVLKINTANWQWHPDRPHSIYYWWEEEELGEADFPSYVDLAELSKTRLVVHENWIDDYTYLPSILITTLFPK